MIEDLHERRKRVLIIDDELATVDYVTYFLGKANCTVSIARGCKEGIAVAVDFRPDLVICDLKMPEIDGFACARLIRAVPALMTVPLVALTGMIVPGQEGKARASGFDGYVEKPMNPWELVDRLKSFLRWAKSGALRHMTADSL